MHARNLFLGATWLLSRLAAPVSAGLYPEDAVDRLAALGLDNLGRYLNQTSGGTCTLETAVKRREWSDLSVPEREDYIKAVLCLQSLPARHDSKKIPGAKSRFDDFVAVHINLTNQVHGTANFLGWHRVYLWLYETALREECGYKGYQPYNNWARYASDPANSPIFNGNASSMSGNGEKFTYDGIFVGMGSNIPPDQGGGCVTSGPFKNMSVNLGPIAPGSASLKVPANPQRDGLGHNPRCLRRDVNRYSAAHTAANYTEALITNASDVGTFQNRMQGQGLTNTFGVHIGGHYTIGGDPGGDFFVSPGDPAFYLHHGMIDRVWWIWQNQKLPGRLSEIAGGTSMGGFPGGANKPGTLQDDILYGVLGQTRKLKDALDTMAGPLCYIYA